MDGMELWYKYTTKSDRELFASVNNIKFCCKNCFDKKSIQQEVQENLQITINKVFSSISIKEFIEIYKCHPSNNSLIIKYFIGNLLYHLECLCLLHKSEILYHSLDYNFDDILLELDKFPEIQLGTLYNHTLFRRYQFPYGLINDSSINHLSARGARGSIVYNPDKIKDLLENAYKHERDSLLLLTNKSWIY